MHFHFCFSELSNIKLGNPDDEPEYNDVSWFVMLFACGMGNGLFFYSVFEPIYHYTQKNRYSADPTLTDNQLAQTAILIPMFHFGKQIDIRIDNIKLSEKYGKLAIRLKNLNV